MTLTSLSAHRNRSMPLQPALGTAFQKRELGNIIIEAILSTAGKTFSEQCKEQQYFQQSTETF